MQRLISSFFSLTDHRGPSFFLLTNPTDRRSENIQINSSSVKYYSQTNGDLHDSEAIGAANGINRTNTAESYR